jgi:5-oxoprolinase (ATP-hydrolysing) subunit A
MFRRFPLPSIDLSADLGEGFGVRRMGEDAAMPRVATSANIACVVHADGPDIMTRCFEEAKTLGVNADVLEFLTAIPS